MKYVLSEIKASAYRQTLVAAYSTSFFLLPNIVTFLYPGNSRAKRTAILFCLTQTCVSEESGMEGVAVSTLPLIPSHH